MPQKFTVIGLIGLCALFLLSACATPAATPTPLPPAPTAQSLPTARPLDDDILVIYHKAGGIAGIDETLTIHQGGVVELVTRNGNPKSLLLSEPTLLPIRRMIEQKEFGELESQYQALGADLFVYTITARDSNGKTKTVVTMDGAKNPDYLGLLIVMLENMRAIVAKNG